MKQRYEGCEHVFSIKKYRFKQKRDFQLLAELRSSNPQMANVWLSELSEYS